MAFGYYSPQYAGNYQPQFTPQVPNMAPQAAPMVSTPSNSLVWVQGEAGAKSYLMAPNTTALLMDSESSKMYIKSTDASGMPSLRVFEYKEIVKKEGANLGLLGDTTNEAQVGLNYATRAEFDELKSKVEEILAQKSKGAKSKAQKAEEEE